MKHVPFATDKFHDCRTHCHTGLFLRELPRPYDNTLVKIDASGGKGFNECKLAEVGTATAVNSLASHGIVYSPGRTDARPITRSDACTLLTDTELSSIGGVDPPSAVPAMPTGGAGGVPPL